MCTNYTPTKNADWVKSHIGVDLPENYPDEAYPGFLGPIVMKSQQSGRVACGLGRFGLIPAWVVFTDRQVPDIFILEQKNYAE